MAHVRRKFIVWIKRRDEVDEAAFAESGIEPDAYNHPALVIRAAVLPHELVMICIVRHY